MLRTYGDIDRCLGTLRTLALDGTRLALEIRVSVHRRMLLCAQIGCIKAAGSSLRLSSPAPVAELNCLLNGVETAERTARVRLARVDGRASRIEAELGRFATSVCLPLTVLLGTATPFSSRTFPLSATVNSLVRALLKEERARHM
jgi:hypothetical protein